MRAAARAPLVPAADSRAVPVSRRNAYNMVINKCGDRLYSGLVEKTSSHLATSGRQDRGRPGGHLPERAAQLLERAHQVHADDPRHPDGALLPARVLHCQLERPGFRR